MPDYRRAWHPGGTYFFTVNLLQRQGNDLLTRHIGLLRIAVAAVQRRHPFVIHSWGVLPDHLHCVIENNNRGHGYYFFLTSEYFSPRLHTPHSPF